MMSKKKRKIAYIFMLFLMIISIFLFYFTVSRPIIASQCQNIAVSEIIGIINQSNDVLLYSDFYYNDLVTVRFSDDKIVSSLQVQTSVVNHYMILWGTEIQNSLKNLRDFTVSFPCGRLLGSPFLSEYGRNFTIRCELTCVSEVSFHQTFQEKGINQTLHVLSLSVQVKADFLTPSYVETQTVQQSFILCQGIIAGKVPETYIAGIEEPLNYLDLIE